MQYCKTAQFQIGYCLNELICSLDGELLVIMFNVLMRIYPIAYDTRLTQ